MQNEEYIATSKKQQKLYEFTMAHGKLYIGSHKRTYVYLSVRQSMRSIPRLLVSRIVVRLAHQPCVVRSSVCTHPLRGYKTSKKMTLFPAVNMAICALRRVT
ncbi:uncharacterized protein LOC128860640 [Anastrepha ludens]|uniref:uncharacterized protein LOC128860640 n=1 Tax=Anastrepha ludens TaxID=28586 RepID=UPI0023AFA877|nr:uncharacterized protein LOC128860640 [Anastrepha ludens]